MGNPTQQGYEFNLPGYTGQYQAPDPSTFGNLGSGLDMNLQSEGFLGQGQPGQFDFNAQYNQSIGALGPNPTSPPPSFWDTHADKFKTGMQGLNAIAGFSQALIGGKQLELMKEGLKQSEKQFNLEFGAQKSLTNGYLRDRQDSRISAAQGTDHTYQDTDSYVKERGIA